ncbi:MAG TPA: protein kinase [Acidobacteriota bacterium]|nr:protein kinase [Acidobacteriota bacterium]
MLGKSLGRYQISEKLGAGGMGEVYRAHDERLERDVAVKVLHARTLEDETSRKRFRKEALTLSKLNHPNIATVLDFDSHEDVDFLVMEYIVGTTMSAKLEKGALLEKEIIPYALQIAAAMEDAHAAGIIHRDLKPSNIVVTPKGAIKVLDFGLAKLVQPVTHDAVTKASTETNLIVGTLPYMSPEQLLSEPLDARTDIYSFGVLLYEMSTGHLPHQATQPISLADAILHKTPVPPIQLRSNLSSRFQEIILKCIEKDPANRYQSAKELLVDLRRLATPSMTAAYETAPFLQKTTRQKRKTLIYAGIILLAALAGFAIWKFVPLRSETKQQSLQPQILSIVALPSKVYGSDENLFLADAIPNALSTHLNQIHGLETKVPPTSVELERVGGDLKKLADVYGVNALISSSVNVNNDKFTLNVQLVDADNRNLIWSRDYEGNKGAYLDLVGKASDGLRSALRPQGRPIQPEAATASSTEGELVFQSGFYHLRAFANRKEPAEFDRALNDLQQALKIDPTNARAAAAIARLYSAKIESGSPLREVLPKIDEWAYKALNLDYRCGEAWQILSVAEEWRPSGDKQKRLEYALKAATYASHSGYSHHVLASALAPTSFVLSIHASDEGIQQEPMYLNGLLFSAGILSREGRVKEGLQRIDRVLNAEPQMPVAHLMKVLLLLRDHQFQEAEKRMSLLDTMVAEHKLHPGWVTFARDWLDFEKGTGTGNKDVASTALTRLVQQMRGEAPPFPRWQLVTGNVLTLQARNDSVPATIETLSNRASKGIFEPYDWLLLNPDMEAVRRDSQFKEITERSKAEFDAMMKVLQEARTRKELPAYLEKSMKEVGAGLRPTT